MADRIEHPYGQINVDTLKKWFRMDPAEDGNVWMINLMKYHQVAAYHGDDAPTISGKDADDVYAPVDVLKDLGAMVAFFGDVERQVEGDPAWDRIAIVRYPSRASFFAMQERDDFKEKHVHKAAGMEFTVIVGGLPVGEAVEIPSGGSYVMRVRRLAPGATAPVDPAGVTSVARFSSDGTIIGDEREWDEVLFDVVDDDQIDSLIGQPGVEEQITLVVDRYLDRLTESVTTG